MIRSTTASAAAIAVIMIAAAAPALAQKEVRPQSPLISALGQCRAIADSTKRLACYDGASARLVGAATSGEVTVVDRSELRQARRSLFGFNMPKLPFFGGDTSAESDTGTLETTAIEARSSGNGGRFLMKLAEGNAWWEITETYVNFDPPRKGSKVVIKRGPMGSYFVRIDGQRGVRGRRVS